jgi:hypothetical protein
MKDNYFKVDAISQSGLTNFSYGPQYYKSKQTQEFQDSEALEIGSLVDDYLSNVSEKEIEEKYVIADIPKPTGQMGEFVDAILYYENNSLEGENVYDLAYKKVGFKRDSIEKVILKFNEECLKYYKFRLESEKKVVLSQEEYYKAKNVYNSLITNPYTSKHLTVPKHVNSIKQLEIYWQTMGKACKAKLDDVWFDNETGKYHIKDFKTTGFHVSEFQKSFLRFRYDLQAAFYRDATDYYCNQHQLPYSFGSFTFIVESTKYVGTPMIYRCGEQDLYCGKYGGIGQDGKKYKGYSELMTDLIWHIEQNEWSYPREVIENEGVIEINGFKKDP